VTTKQQAIDRCMMVSAWHAAKALRLLPPPEREHLCSLIDVGDFEVTREGDVVRVYVGDRAVCSFDAWEFFL
jgi:hypothetical protein